MYQYGRMFKSFLATLLICFITESTAMGEGFIWQQVIDIELLAKINSKEKQPALIDLNQQIQEKEFENDTSNLPPIVDDNGFVINFKLGL